MQRSNARDATGCLFNLKLPMKRRTEALCHARDEITAALDRSRLRHRLAFKHLYHERLEVTGYCARAGSKGPGARPGRSGK